MLRGKVEMTPVTRGSTSAASCHLENGNIMRVTVVVTRLLLLILICVSPCLASQEQKTKSVLILHDGWRELAMNSLSDQEIRQALGSDQTLNVQYFEEYTETYRLKTEYPALADILRQKYSGQRIDLIVAVGQTALRFLCAYSEKLWPKIPIVFFMVEMNELPATLPPYSTGVSGVIDFAGSLALALRLQPDTRHVFYVSGVSIAEEINLHTVQRDFQSFAGKVEITYLIGLPLQRLLPQLRHLPTNSIVFYTQLLQDVNGDTYVPTEVCPAISAAANVPVYGAFETQNGLGIVGGSIVAMRQNAREGAELGLRILRGSLFITYP